jgi:serine protease inhibitor
MRHDMMRWNALALALAAVLLPASAAGSDTESNRATASLQSGMARFNAELLHQLSILPGDQVCSPLASYGAVAILACGAHGQTRIEMERVLGITDPRSHLPELASLIAQAAPARSQAGPNRSNLAICCFPRLDVKIVPAFADACTLAGVGLVPLDFAGNIHAAGERIGDWNLAHVSKRTGWWEWPNIVDARSDLVLTALLHMRLAWQDGFPMQHWLELPYHLPGQRVIPIGLMQAVHELPYAEVDGAQVVALACQGGACDCLVVVPRAMDGLQALEQSLDGPGLERLCASARTPRLVSIALPMLHLPTGLQPMRPILMAMGMTTACDAQRADFSGIGTTRMHLGDIILGGLFELDARGLGSFQDFEEASGNAPASDKSGPAIFAVTADHPFLLIVRHRASGAILQLVHVIDPAAYDHITHGPPPAPPTGGH